MINHLVSEPWKSQEVGVGVGSGLDKYRVVQHLVREPWKSHEVCSRGRCRLGLVQYRVT